MPGCKVVYKGDKMWRKAQIWRPEDRVLPTTGRTHSAEASSPCERQMEFAQDEKTPVDRAVLATAMRSLRIDFRGPRAEAGT